MNLTNFNTKTYSFVQYDNLNEEHEKLFKIITNDELSETFFKDWKTLFKDNDNDVISAFVIEKERYPIGITTLVQQNDNDYILSYIISPQYRGNNYSSQIIMELLDHLFTIDKVYNVISYIHKNNKSSISGMLKTNPDDILDDPNDEDMLKVIYTNKKINNEFNNKKNR